MRTALILVLLFFVMNTAYAQNYQSVEDVDAACSQLGFMSDEEAEITIDNILDEVGLFRNFTIAECPNINNAIAKNIEVEKGKKARYILYDAKFFDRISDKASNDWAATSILAHEIGHHLNGHSLNNEGSNHKWELEADEFSGFVLAKMGASLKDAQAAINTLKYEKATRTHPAKADRLIAIAKGWKRGSGKKIFTPVEDTEIAKEEEKPIVTDNPTVTNNSVVTDIPSDNPSSWTRKQRAQNIMARYIDKVGGADNIARIKSMSQDLNFTSEYSDMDMKMTMLSPENYLSEIEINGNAMYSLKIDGKTYQKSSKNEPWKFLNFSQNDGIWTSFVLEYGLLVNNQDVSYLGRDRINGVLVDVVEIPEYRMDTETDEFKSTSTTRMYQYYNAETGMLEFSKTVSRTSTDFMDNTYIEDSNTDTEVFTAYSDYREVNGVLFPFKRSMTTDTGKFKSEMVMTYTSMEANPQINPNDFRVNN